MNCRASSTEPSLPAGSQWTWSSRICNLPKLYWYPGILIEKDFSFGKASFCNNLINPGARDFSKYFAGLFSKR